LKQAIAQITTEADILRYFFPSIIFSMFIVMLGMCWIPEHRLSSVQFYRCQRAFVISLNEKLQYAKEGGNMKYMA
jgi:hypothetical protein